MRIFFKVLRAGSGTPAKYSSTFFGAPLPFAAELRFADFTFFMRGRCYKSFHLKSMPEITALGLGCESPSGRAFGGAAAVDKSLHLAYFRSVI